MNWSVFQAVAIGTSHVERQMPCQDACQSWVDGNVLVAAVADGAGSASRSELGARLCVDVVVDAIRECFEPKEGVIGVVADSLAESRNRLISIIEVARRKIYECASEIELAPRELACTLIGVVAILPGEGYFFHIGDGIGVAQFEDVTIPPTVSAPENGEYSNETWFITSENWREHVRTTVFEGPLTTLAIMSDGVMPFALTKDKNRLFPDFIGPVASYLKERSPEEGNVGLQSILESERTNAITNDDKTLVLAFPRP